MINTKVLEEAYKKIIADKELQKKFVEAAKENKLEIFLKDQKIEATVEEVKKYVIEAFTNKDGELSKGELDLAAGGKDHDTKVSWAIISVLLRNWMCCLWNRWWCYKKRLYEKLVFYLSKLVKVTF